MLFDSKRQLTTAERRSIWESLLSNNTTCLPKQKSTIVSLYYKCMLCISCHFGLLKPLTLRMDLNWFRVIQINNQCRGENQSRMDHAKLLDVLTSLPVSHATYPRAVCFEPIRRRLFRDHIINGIIIKSINKHLLVGYWKHGTDKV